MNERKKQPTTSKPIMRITRPQQMYFDRDYWIYYICRHNMSMSAMCVCVCLCARAHFEGTLHHFGCLKRMRIVAHLHGWICWNKLWFRYWTANMHSGLNANCGMLTLTCDITRLFSEWFNFLGDWKSDKPKPKLNPNRQHYHFGARTYTHTHTRTRSTAQNSWKGMLFYKHYPTNIITLLLNA